MEKYKIKNIIFDLGGVVVEDIGPAFLTTFTKVLKTDSKKISKVLRQEEHLIQIGKESSFEFWQRICRLLKVDPPNDKVLTKLWSNNYLRHARIKRDTFSLIKKLRRNYTLGIISNTILDHAKINVKRKFFSYFDFVVFSNEIGMRKSDQKIFRHVLKAYSLKAKETIFIDDDIRWVRSAQKAGLNAVTFRSTEKLEKDLRKFGVLINQ